MTEIRTLFGATLIEIHRLLTESAPALVERFDSPSALRELTVRGLAGHLLRAMASLEGYLDRPGPTTRPPERLIEVYAGLVLTLDEYLVTRLTELVVHGDDLAVSLGVAPPALSPDATGLVIATLVEVARIGHGDTAVVRALARRERDTVGALRVI